MIGLITKDMEQLNTRMQLKSLEFQYIIEKVLI